MPIFEAKVIPTKSKFTSELNPYDPDDAEEMNRRVFGAEYRTDRQGNPVDESRGSDAFWISDAQLPRDPLRAQELQRKILETARSHLAMIRQYGPTGHCAPSSHFSWQFDADQERDRIQALRAVAGLKPLPI
ncbi:hypothetical protein DLM45_15335 [Hyphomicrobium methylovorum]|uniref:hypothetical protein n=1 Tax=Hyphomicrobium methylovorum TaxID=84 RepID=UPI0015E7B34C|nr:hypothetical protein [Hyphomicrobium methylovorum]MBA2127584.1 hypothetical protein [Hyphomicrobium methylovorum]